jgi:hypothetical protein
VKDRHNIIIKHTNNRCCLRAQLMNIIDPNRVGIALLLRLPEGSCCVGEQAMTQQREPIPGPHARGRGRGRGRSRGRGCSGSVQEAAAVAVDRAKGWRKRVK